MGSIYPRGSVLWLAYMGPDGKRVFKSSGLLVGNEAEARHVLRAVERQVAAEILHAPEGERGPPTVESFGKRFFEARVRAGIDIASKEQARLKKYVVPFKTVGGVPFGSLKLADVRPFHVRDFVRHLKTLGIAPRTARAVYFQLKLMFHEAVTDELISATPCALKKGDLPKKVDKDPTWRHTAKFDRGEVEALISDARIPELRRVRYAGLFLTGMRINELGARRFREMDTQAEPLWRLVVPTSFHRKSKRVKAVKTEVPREVPVHPTLARALAAWRLSGFERAFGRPPRPDDLVWPSATLEHLRDPTVLKELHLDCVALGLRPRRTHDTRRTFISLARGDGANKDVLKRVTHGARGDQLDEYTSFDWSVLCEAVSKLKVKPLDGKLLSLPVAANAGGSVQALHPQLQSKAKSQQPAAIPAHIAAEEFGRGGTRTPDQPEQDSTIKNKTVEASGACLSIGLASHEDIPPDRHNVASALADSRSRWVETGDRRALRRSLLALLAELEGGES